MDNISNVDGQDLAYFHNAPAWHKKGEVGKDNETAQEVGSRMPKINFEIRPFGIQLTDDGEFKPTGKHFGIVRWKNGKANVVGQIKGRYNLTQPSRYWEIFDESVGYPVETLGFLGSFEEKMFLTWKLPRIDVHGDLVDWYGFLHVGFDGKLGEKLYETGVRVVCQNTASFAMANGTMQYSAKHYQKDHEYRLGVWMAYGAQEAQKNVKIWENLFCRMDDTKVTKSKAYDMFRRIYPMANTIGEYYPDVLRTKDSVKIFEYNKKQTERIDLAMSLFEGAGIEISQTGWGVFNTVTEMQSHTKWVPSKKDIVSSILVGDRQTIVQRALSVVSEYVGV